MPTTRTSRVSLRDIAAEAGISSMAVSYALRNRPGVSTATHKRVLRIAQRLGYAPDARLTSWMARVQETKSKDLLPIAWLNTSWDKSTWTMYSFFSPYLEGAQERCQQLGYRIEHLWTREPGMSAGRLAQILYQRGIEGLIITDPAQHIRLRWDRLASVALGGALLAPRLHRIDRDNYFNLTLALKILRRHDYRRIGICLQEHMDRFAHRIHHSVASHFASSFPPSQRIPILYYSREHELGPANELLTAWVRRYRPEVIVGADSRLVSWLQAVGYKVPTDIGVVHLWLDDDVLDWAGIHSNKREMGATAAEQVISLVQNRRFGVPQTPLTTLVRGSWQFGKTLRTPR